MLIKLTKTREIVLGPDSKVVITEKGRAEFSSKVSEDEARTQITPVTPGYVRVHLSVTFDLVGLVIEWSFMDEEKV